MTQKDKALLTIGGNRREVLTGLALGAVAVGTGAAGILGGGVLTGSKGRAYAADKAYKMAFIQFQPHTVSTAWAKGIKEVLDIQPGITFQLLDGQAKADVQISLMDTVINDGVNVIFDIDGAPDWAGAAQAGEFGTTPQLYADFAAKVAARYKNTIRVFELGNEPNHSHYVNTPNPATYTSLLKLAYPAIKKADPNAFVLVGGIGGVRDNGGDIDPLTFVRALYQDGAKGYFDGLAYHPYTYPELPTQEISIGDRGWSRMLSVRSIMVQNGDAAKQIWITEFGAPTNGPGGVSQQQQAAIMQNGFQLWSSYSWGGTICWFSYADKGNDPSTHKDWFGIVDSAGAHKASYAAYSSLARS